MSDKGSDGKVELDKEIKADVKDEKNSSKLENQKDKNEELIKQNKELSEKFLRLAADFENYKKRTAVDIESSKDMGKFEIMKSLLTILDEFELTVIAASKSSDKSIVKGVDMLYSNFRDTLKKSGLSEVNTKGIYDPYIHEIVLVQDDDQKEGTILEVIKKGYIYSNKLLRVASVIISSGKIDNKNKEKNNEEN